MKDFVFPKKLDEASVLFYTDKSNYGAVKYTSGKTADFISYFAICQYNNDASYYLFCCNDFFDVVSDYVCDSIQQCKIIAEQYMPFIAWHTCDF